MALIKCKGCGNMISDRAPKCPKCGYDYTVLEGQEPQVCQESQVPPTSVDSGRSRKGLYITLSVISLVIIAAIIIFFVIRHNKEVAQLEAANIAQQERLDSIAAAEQARIAEEHRRDSLYANFTTPDLNTFQVKGFVKRITMETSCVCAAYKQFITLDFDKEGVLKSATSSLVNSYNPAKQNITYKIKREGDYIKALSYKRSTEAEGLTSVFSFTMDSQALHKVVIDFCDSAGVDWDMINATIVLGDYNDKNLPTTINYSDDSSGGIGMWHTYDSYVSNIDYSMFDSNGNWTELKINGIMKSKTIEMSTKNVENEWNRQYNNTLTRAITYYTPEEIFGKDSEVDDALSNNPSNSGSTSASIINEYNRLSVKTNSYTGEIGENKIEAELKFYGANSQQIIGKYRYIRSNVTGNWLGLKGNRNGNTGSIILYEYNAVGKNTGKCEIDGKTLRGIFTLMDGKNYAMFLKPKQQSQTTKNIDKGTNSKQKSSKSPKYESAAPSEGSNDGFLEW